MTSNFMESRYLRFCENHGSKGSMLIMYHVFWRLSYQMCTLMFVNLLLLNWIDNLFLLGFRYLCFVILFVGPFVTLSVLNTISIYSKSTYLLSLLEFAHLLLHQYAFESKDLWFKFHMLNKACSQFMIIKIKTRWFHSRF